MVRRSLIVLVLVVLAATPVFANHSWGGYHWARTSNPFTVKINDNIDPIWESYLTTAVSDWNRSTVFDFNVIWQNPLSSDRKCSSTAGQIEICNTTYGQNGWLGIAGISISGSHITKGYTKLNDTYYNMAQYNTPAWRQMVVCQEIAHNMGLDHQDEVQTNANLGSCMDYTNDPDGGAGGGSSNDPSNEHPNQHDYDQLASIYAHTDSTSTISALPMLGTIAAESIRPRTGDEIVSGVDFVGTPVRWDREGRPTVFFAPIRIGAEGVEAEVQHVFWALDAAQNNPGHAGE